MLSENILPLYVKLKLLKMSVSKVKGDLLAKLIFYKPHYINDYYRKRHISKLRIHDNQRYVINLCTINCLKYLKG